MKFLMDRVVNCHNKSSSLKTLQDQLSASKYLRSSWFNNWVDIATAEISLGFPALIKLFFLKLLNMDNGVWENRSLIKKILSNQSIFRDFVNDQIIAEVLRKNSNYFDTIERFPLTPKQREAVASDEDSTLVIAGAGTGKTSTIIAKIGHLVKSGQCKPEEILAISYTNKSAKELMERVKATLNIEVSVSTFHKLGMNILAKAEMGKPLLADFAADPVQKAHFIESVIDELKKIKDFERKLVEFLVLYRIEDKQIWEFSSLAEYVNWLRSNNIVSLDGIRKKSYQECLIANWLILNGIPFVYEKSYKYPTKTIKHSQYCPDFYLTDSDIYIEHFGIDETGKTAPYINNEIYLKGMEWKREAHKTCNTKLIETFSWEFGSGVLFENLEKQLKSYGCIFKPISTDEAINLLNQAGYINGFSELVTSFLTLYKGNDNKLTKNLNLDHLSYTREKRFLELFYPIFEAYEKQNLLNGWIDFEDMISSATKSVNNASFNNPYKYILIDEFQDISLGRLGLIKALQKNLKDCAIFAVGDDWQSIYRFAGSDIGVMTKFVEFFGAIRQVCLETTFRFPEEAAQVSGVFILKNRAQIVKTLSAIHSIKEPSLILHKSPGALNMEKRLAEGPLDWILSEIEKQVDIANTATVFILERYKFHLPERSELLRLQKKFPRLVLFESDQMNTFSIHAAKGLEADYVILGLRGGSWGFPSQVMDDPILDLVLTQSDNYPYGEERRLFYVAITRARYKTYLACETGFARSVFFDELETGKEYHVAVFGKNEKKLVCSKCKSGSMLLRDGSNGQFYGCSNFPHCDHTEQTCPECRKGFFIKEVDKPWTCHICRYEVLPCPKCKMGILKLINGKYGPFYGCSNFKDPEIHCDYKDSPNKSVH